MVLNQTAEVIDLKTYRERKAERRSMAETQGSYTRSFQYGQQTLPLAMPLAFCVFWPIWVYMPGPSFASNKGEEGLA